MNLRSPAAPSVATLMSLSDQFESLEAAIQNLNQQIATMRQESNGSLRGAITELSSLVESQGAITKLYQQQLGDELHGKLNDSNVERIAHLGHFHFHIAPSVLTSCEKFLLFESKLPLETKFRLATKYELKSLIEKLISEMNNVEEIKSVLREHCLKPLG